MSIGKRAGLALVCLVSIACGGSPSGKSTGGDGSAGAEQGGASDAEAGSSSMGNDGAGTGGTPGSASAGAPTVEGDAGAAGAAVGMSEGGAPSGEAGASSLDNGGAPGSSSAGAPNSEGGAPGSSAGAPGSSAGAPGSSAGAPGVGGAGETGEAGAPAAAGGAGGAASPSGCQNDVECAGAPVGPCETPFCNEQTGLCESEPLPYDTACDDGDACTQKDSCRAGLCVGSSPVLCQALDQCHVVGICNAKTGLCSQPSKKDGSVCDDGDACTDTDACDAGNCTGMDPVVCDALDQCHEPGKCDSRTGLCTDPAVMDGLVCDDGHACTSGDECQAGSCGGAAACKMAIDPEVLTLAPGEGHTFSASLTGVQPDTVTWSIEEGAAGGSIDAGGAYLAPSGLSTYHVVATSTADPAMKVSALVTVTLTPVRVSLCPGQATLLPDDTLLITPFVSGTGNQAVTWSVSGGSITNWGLFTPGGTGSFIVTAQSVAEPAKQASATINAVTATLPSISGTIGYAGAKTGTVHVTLSQGDRAGTALTSPGKYRIRGVDISSTQSVTVQAYMDSIGTGKYSAGKDPYGTVTIPSWTGSDVTAVNITLVDPAPVALTAIPGMKVSAHDGFALVEFDGLRNNNGHELADQYRVYVHTTGAVGPSTYLDRVVSRAGAQSVVAVAGLSNGTDYWFAVTPALNGVEGPQVTVGPVSIGAPGGGHAVSGVASFSGLVVTGPLYAIAYNVDTQTIYASGYKPSTSDTAQPFSIGGLPDGSYRLGVAIDQNDDGELGPHDPLTLEHGGDHPFNVAGADLAGEDVTVPSTWAAGRLTTHLLEDSSYPYALDFRVGSNSKLPIAAWLSSGANTPAPADLGVELYDSHMTLRRTLSVSDKPLVGDSYGLNVLYEDGVTCDLPVQVTGVWNALPTQLAPIGPGTGTPIPEFFWLAPSSVPSYFSYELSVWGGNMGGELWRFAGASSDTSVVYDFDGNAQQGMLSQGVSYQWGLSAQDRFGNSARAAAYFSLPVTEASEPNDLTATTLPAVSACEQNPWDSYAAGGLLTSGSDVDLFQFDGSTAPKCTSNPTITASPGVRACLWATCDQGSTTFTSCAAGLQTVVDGVTACCSDTAGLVPSASYGFTCSVGGLASTVTIHVSNGTGPYGLVYHY